MNLILIFRGPDWRKTIGQFVFIACCVTLGTLLGSQILIYADKTVLKGVLAAMLLLTLTLSYSSSIRNRITFNPNSKLIQALFGFAAGVMGGAVNITVLFLALYFTHTDYAPVVLSQAFNLCFIFSKLSQAILLSASGQFGLTEIVLGTLLCLVAVAAQRPGLRLQDGISKTTYKSYLNLATLLITLLVLWNLWVSVGGR